jgi:hypothetical protein
MVDPIYPIIISVSASIMSIFFGILGIILSYYLTFSSPGDNLKKKIKTLVVCLLIIIFFNSFVTIYSILTMYCDSHVNTIITLFIFLIIIIPVFALFFTILNFRKK